MNAREMLKTAKDEMKRHQLNQFSQEDGGDALEAAVSRASAEAIAALILLWTGDVMHDPTCQRCKKRRVAHSYQGMYVCDPCLREIMANREQVEKVREMGVAICR